MTVTCTSTLRLGVSTFILRGVHRASVFANNNARANPGTTAQICAIFAKSSEQWISTRKAFFPPSLRGDSAVKTSKDKKEQNRVEYLENVFNTRGTSGIVRFGLLDERDRDGE